MNYPINISDSKKVLTNPKENPTVITIQTETACMTVAVSKVKVKERKL